MSLVLGLSFLFSNPTQVLKNEEDTCLLWVIEETRVGQKYLARTQTSALCKLGDHLFFHFFWWISEKKLGNEKLGLEKSNRLTIEFTCYSCLLGRSQPWVNVFKDELLSVAFQSPLLTRD